MPKISLVTLGVSDLGRARAFYADGLAWPVKDVPSDEIVFLPLAGAWLALFGREALAADSGVAPEGSGFRGVTLAHNVESRAAVDAFVARAEQAGARVVASPAEKPWGGYAGVFADPDGHLWEVAWNPHLDLT